MDEEVEAKTTKHGSQKKLNIVNIFSNNTPESPTKQLTFHNLIFAKDVFDNIAKSLDRDGFCVMDKVFGKERCKLLRSELETMATNNEFDADPSTKENPDGEKEVISTSHFYTKQLSEDVLGAEGEDDSEWSDEETPVEKKKKQPSAVSPLKNFVNNFASRVVLELNARIQLLELSFTTAYNKIAYSTNGAFLPKHLDNDGSNRFDMRKLTIILYLNPQWQKPHSGQLRLHLLDGSVKDIDPTDDRVVFFWSDLIVHEVLPVMSPETDKRFTVTIWLPTKNKNKIHEDKQLYWQLITKHFSDYIY